MLLPLGAPTGAALLSATGATAEFAAGAEYALNEVVGVETGATVLSGAEYVLSGVVDIEIGATGDSWVDGEADGRPE